LPVQVDDTMAANRVLLDGISLTCRTLSHLGRPGATIGVADAAMERVARARVVVDNLVQRGFSEGHVAYGINTGFGLFADVIIPNDQLTQLQRNLIRSHSAGVGEPLSPAETRRLLALRINVLAKGHSGIRTETVQQMVDAFNNNCLSVVPSQGTVGASGDLAPLAVRFCSGCWYHVVASAPNCIRV
jgi:histidine ammonia-lyase